MNTVIWHRNGGYVYAILFANGISCAVSAKSYKTKKGCEAALLRLRSLCDDPTTGEAWHRDLPYFATNTETGATIKLHTRENVVNTA